MNRQRVAKLVFFTTLLLSLLLMLVPFPEPLRPFKPYWPALVLIYWSLESTHRVSLGLAFWAGLAADVVDGALLGEQALRLVVLVFLVLRFRSRLRFFPMWQQALAVLALLLNDRVVQVVVHTLAGDPLPSMWYWLSPVVGALLWPFVFLLLDSVRTRLRMQEA